MIDSQKVLYSPGDNDECATPKYAVEPILKYIKTFSAPTIWCPFDKSNSQFVQLIHEAGAKVFYSHIDTGQDFYTYAPPIEWDIMISNPPFCNKRKIFERALSFGKPFALLMSLTWLNDSAPKILFMERDLELLMFDRRIEFLQADGKVNKKITFSSAYYCWNFLPKQIIMERLERS
jgi:hypothetical protein